jgi:hypothetical protein
MTVACATEQIQKVSDAWCHLAVKKEKRARNEQMARQFRKAETVGRGRGGGYRAAAQRENDADSEWLSQIYGQHTIYRKDQAAGAVTAATTAVRLQSVAAVLHTAARNQYSLEAQVLHFISFSLSGSASSHF